MELGIGIGMNMTGVAGVDAIASAASPILLPHLMLNACESASLTTDLSPQDNTIILLGSVTAQAGKVGTAAKIPNGLDNALRINAVPAINLGAGTLTVEAWFLVPAAGLSPNVVQKSSGPTYDYVLWISDDSGALVADFYNEPDEFYNSADRMTYNAWHHVIAGQDISNSVYWMIVDGGTLRTSPITGPPQSTDGELYIGLNVGEGYFLANAVRLYDFRPTAETCAWLYNSGSGRTYAELAAYTG